jgi:TRAP-type uncharacterized transport system substrate-binding protein
MPIVVDAELHLGSRASLMFAPLLHWIYDRKVPLLACVLCVALSFPLASRFLFSGEDAVLRMSAGPNFTRRHAVADYVRRQAEANGLSIQLIENAGSEDCLERLKRGELDAALVSSGVVVPDDQDIRVLAAAHVEAVHMLVRKELAEPGQLARNIRGQRVNIGVRGSTEWLLGREFLNFARLKLPSGTSAGDIVLTELSKQQLHDQALAILQAQGQEKARLIAALPDCVLVLATRPSLEVQALVEAADYQIMSLPATRAFLLDNLQDSNAPTTVIEREFLEPTVIPANSYFAGQGFPATDCETVGVRLLFVTHKQTSPTKIRALMQTLFEGEFSRRMQPQSPRELATPYAIHPAAMAYFDRNNPVLAHDMLENVGTVLSILGAFGAGAFTLYGLAIRRQTRKPADYYAEIRKLDLLARNALLDGKTPLLPHELTKYLSDRLLKLREELIEDVCEARIEGDQVVTNILQLLADSRQHLLRPEHAPPGVDAPHPTTTTTTRPHIPARRAG